jgi:HD-GYP domain-containing protein (c-di-GMP phosphodiesterase class II)
MNELMNEIIKTFKIIYESNNLFAIFISLTSLVILITVFTFIFYKKYINSKKNLISQKNISTIFDNIDIDEPLESNLNSILKIVSTLIFAPTYSLYTFDNKNGNYILKAVSNAMDDPSLKISYSGLLPYKKEAYVPPLSVKKEIQQNGTQIIKDGSVPLLSIMTPDKKTLIRIGPFSDFNKNTKKLFDEFAIKLNSIIKILNKTNTFKSNIQIYEKSSNALHNITNIVLNHQTILGRALKISINSIESTGAFILHKDGNNYKLITIESLNDSFKNEIKKNSNSYSIFDDLSEEIGVSIITKKEKTYSQLPNYFKKYNFETIYIANATEDDENLISVYIFNRDVKINSENISSTIFMNTCKMCTIFGNYTRTKELSNSYIEILKLVTEIIDSMSPETVGFSELASRYSIVIARELDLNYNEISKISLAAFLSDIGNISFLEDLKNIHKDKDLRSDFKKAHTEISESIIKITLGDKKISKYIRHHHERIDGNGYPDGLRGDEIPIGSKIISIVHSFLSKIMGLHGSEPMAFDKALESLKLSSGKQFDSKLVDIFIEWFSNKQNNPEYMNKSLGNCWDMRCSPPEICYDCPVFKQSASKCWEVDNVKCKRHGNTCNTCFIKSEYMTRKKLVNNYE